MGGPTFMLHLRQALSGDSRKEIHAWVVAHATPEMTHIGIQWEFHFRRENACTCSIAIVPFGAESRGNGEATEAWLADLDGPIFMAALGYCPVQSLQFNSYCRSRAELDHKMLAQYAADLARQHDGVIELGQAISVFLKAGGLNTGQYYPLEDEEHPDSIGYLVDADLMDEWIKHPGFHLDN